MNKFTDPRVVAAIRRSYEKRMRKRNRKTVLLALERAGLGTLAELMELTGLDKSECGQALDELEVRGWIVRAESEAVTGSTVFGSTGKGGEKQDGFHNVTTGA